MSKCASCRFNTNDFVCHPHCSGCDDFTNYERTSKKMIITNEVTQAIHANAIEHGWWDEERSVSEIVALIHSELSEALEEYRNGHAAAEIYYSGEKPEGLPVELADTVIRILDYAGKRKWNIRETLELRSGAKNKGFIFPELVAKCHYFISKGYAEEETRSVYFADCINLIGSWCEDNGVDIEAAIAEKHEYNKSRPYRHGGKKC